MDTTTRPTVWELARMADCADPDTNDSPGARLLDSVYDQTIDALTDGSFDDETAHAIADSAPDVYTYTRWQEFVDLAAWQEDITDLAGDTSDLTQAAGVALYMIAERLVTAIAADYEPADEDEDET